MQQKIIRTEDDNLIDPNAAINSSEKQSTNQVGTLIFGIGTEIILKQAKIKLGSLEAALSNDEIALTDKQFNVNSGKIYIGVRSQFYSGTLIFPLESEKKIELKLSKEDFDEGLKWLNIDRLEQIRQLSGSTDKFLNSLRNSNSIRQEFTIDELNKKILNLLLELIPKVSVAYAKWSEPLATFEKRVKSSISNDS